MAAQLKRNPGGRVMHLRTATPLGLAALVLHLACGDRKSEVATVERSTHGDTTWVRNHRPVHADTATLREIKRIGVRDGPSEYVFANINALTASRTGSIFVSDDGKLLREYDGEGDYVRTIAREGQGPGEVQHVVGLSALPDGRILARDLANGRITVFDSTGDYHDQWPNPEGQPGYGPNAVTFDTSGAIYLGINPSLPADDTPLGFPRPIFVKLSSSGNVLDTLVAEARFTDECPFQSRRWFRSGWFEDLRVHYLPKVKWAVAPSGDLIVGCPARYVFDRISQSGSVIRVARDWEPVVVSDEELETYKQAQAISRSSSGYFDSWNWKGPDLTNSLPAYQSFIPAADGRLWVWPGQPREQHETPEQFVQAGYPDSYWDDTMTGAFDVFDADGRFLGSVALPSNLPYTYYPATPDPYIRGDTVWAMTVDSLDVQYLSVFEVVWPSEEARPPNKR